MFEESLKIKFAMTEKSQKEEIKAASHMALVLRSRVIDACTQHSASSVHSQGF